MWLLVIYLFLSSAAGDDAQVPESPATSQHEENTETAAGHPVKVASCAQGCFFKKSASDSNFLALGGGRSVAAGFCATGETTTHWIGERVEFSRSPQDTVHGWIVGFDFYDSAQRSGGSSGGKPRVLTVWSVPEEQRNVHSKPTRTRLTPL